MPLPASTRTNRSRSTRTAGSGSRERPRLAIGAAVLVAASFIITGLATRPDRAAQAGAGLAAHTLCSAVFVSGLDPDETYRQFLKLHLGDFLSRLVSFVVDRERQTVRASFGGLFDAEATYTQGYGCRLTLPGNGPLSGRHAVGATPPPVPRPQTTRIVSEDPAVGQAMSAVFREHPNGPLKQVNAVVVMVGDRIVSEGYAPGTDESTPLLGYSVAKSFTNALLGILVQQRRLQIDQRVAAPEWAGTDDPRSRITLEDLLRMQSGLNAPETGSGFDAATRMLFTQSDMAAYAATRPSDGSPGTMWSYSSANTLILNRVLAGVVGGREDGMKAFARRELFAPLGMGDVMLEFDGAGVFIGSSYVYADARSFARFGALYAADGVAPDGRRILPEGWVDWSRRSTLGSPYGAGFWTNDGPDALAAARVRLGFPKDGFHASGNFGQRIYIVPSRRLVVARFGYSAPPDFGIEDDLRLIRAVLLSHPGPNLSGASQ